MIAFDMASHADHASPILQEAQEGGPIGLVEDGDEIYIDAVNNTIDMRVSDEVLAKRRESWKPREPKVKSGTLYKYMK